MITHSSGFSLHVPVCAIVKLVAQNSVYVERLLGAGGVVYAKVGDSRLHVANFAFLSAFAAPTGEERGSAQ